MRINWTQFSNLGWDAIKINQLNQNLTKMYFLYLAGAVEYTDYFSAEW